MTETQHHTLISGDDWKCLKSQDVIIGKHQDFISNGEQKTCYTSCHDQTFQSKISHAKYPSSPIFQNSIEFCYIFKKILRSCQNFKKRSLILQYDGICDDFEKYQTMNFKCDTLSYKHFKVMTKYKILKYSTNDFALGKYYEKNLKFCGQICR